MHATHWLLLGLFYFFVAVSSNPAGQSRAVDCSYICNPENGLQYSCSLRCPEYSDKQQSGTSKKSHESHFPTTAVVTSLVIVCLVAVALVVIYRFRERIFNRSQLNSLCKKFGYPTEATSAENNVSAKFAGKTDEHEMESLRTL